MATLEAILGAINNALSILGTLLGISSTISGQTAHAAQENVPYAIDTATSEILAIVTDSTFGNAALQSQIATLTAQLAIDVTAILTAVGTPQQAGSPVTLPSFGGTDIGSVVWGYPTAEAPFTTQGQLQNANRLAMNLGEGGNLPSFYSPYFTIIGWDQLTSGTINSAPYPNVSLSTILPSDTVLSWLTRELTGWRVGVGLGSPQYVGAFHSGYPLIYQSIWDDLAFGQLKQQLFPSSVNQVPPSWPGIANVVLGSPVAFSGDVTVTGPMSGVIVVITGAPSKQGQFTYDGIVSWRNAGGLIFTDDNGDSEVQQLLGLVNAVYCPRSMVLAASVSLRVEPGITGSVTPWNLA